MAKKLFLDNSNEIDTHYIAQVRDAMGTLQIGQLKHRDQTLSFQNLLNMQYRASKGAPSFREEIPITNGTNTKYHLHYIKNDDDSIRIFELQDENRNPIGIFQTSNSKTENKAIEDRGAFLSEGGGLSFQPNSTTSPEQARGALTFIANNLENLRFAIVDNTYTRPTASQSPVVAPDAETQQFRRQGTLERVKEQRKQSLIDETKAAVKIQRAFRENKGLGSHYDTEEDEVQAILDATDEDHGAAIKIQNAFRTYVAKKELERLKAEKAKEKGLDDPAAADAHQENMEDQYSKLPQGEELGDVVLNRIERNEEIRTFGNEDQTDYAKNGLLNFVGSGFNNKKTKHPHDRIKMDEFGLFTAHYDNKRAMHVLDYASASRFANSAIIRKSNTSTDISDFQFIAYDNERFAFRSENGLDGTFDPEADVKEVSPPELIYTDPTTGQPKMIIGAEVEVIRAKIQDRLRAQNAITDEQEAIKKQILDHIKDPEKPAPAGYDAQIANFKSIIGIEDGKKYEAAEIDTRASNPQVAEKLRREIKFSNSAKLPADLEAKLKKKGKDASGADIEIDVSAQEREKILASYERHTNRDASRKIMSEIAKEETLEKDSLGQLNDFVDHIKSNSSDRASSIFKDIDKFPVISGQDGIATSVAPTPNAGSKHRTANTCKISFNFNGKNPEEKEQFMEILGTGLFARVKYVPNGTGYTVWKDGKPDYKTAEGDQVVIDENTLWKKSYNKDGNPITVPFKVNSTSKFSSGPSNELKKGKMVPGPNGNRIAESGFIDPDFIARRYNEFAIEAIAQIDRQVTCASYKSLDKGKVVAVNPSTVSIDIVRRVDKNIVDLIASSPDRTVNGLNQEQKERLDSLVAKREEALDNYVKKGFKSRELSNELIKSLGGKPMKNVWKSEYYGSGITINKSPSFAVEEIAQKTFNNSVLKALGGEAETNEFLRRVTQFAAEVAQDDFFASSKETAISKSISAACSILVAQGKITSEEEYKQYKGKLLDQIGSYSKAKSNKQFRKSNWWGVLHTMTGGLSYAAAKAYDASEHSGYQNTTGAFERLRDKEYDSGADFQAHMKIHDRNILALITKDRKEKGQGRTGLSDDELMQLKQEINAREKALDNISKSGLNSRATNSKLLETLKKGGGLKGVRLYDDENNQIPTKTAVSKIAESVFSNSLLKRLSSFTDSQDLVQNEFLRRITRSAAEVSNFQLRASSKESVITRFVDAATRELVERRQISTEAELQIITNKLTENIKGYAAGRKLKNTNAAAEKVDGSLKFAEMGQESKATQNRDMATATVMAIDILSEAKPASELTEEQKGLLESLSTDAITAVIKGFNAKEGVVNNDYDPQQPEAVKPDRLNSSKTKRGSSLYLDGTGGFKEKVKELAGSIFGKGVKPDAKPDTQSTLEFLQLLQFNSMAADFTLDCAKKFDTHENTSSKTGALKEGWKGNKFGMKKSEDRENRRTFLSKAQTTVETLTSQKTATEDPFKDALLQAAKDRAIKPKRGDKKMTKAAMTVSGDDGKTRKDFRAEVRKDRAAEDTKPTAKGWVTKIKEKEAASKEQGDGGIVPGA